MPAPSSTALASDQPAETRPVLTTVELCRETGASFRQVDYWARTGLVGPSICKADGAGTQRLYSAADAVKVQMICRLLDAGLTLARIRELALTGDERVIQLGHNVTLTITETGS